MVALKFTCISQFHFVESSYLSDTQAPFFFHSYSHYPLITLFFFWS